MWRAAGATWVLLILEACGAPQPVAPTVSKSECGVEYVVDGDTVEMMCPGGAPFRARLTGFDTPEIFSPRCTEEKRLGLVAKHRLQQLVQRAEAIETRVNGTDTYGRRLVDLRLDGTDVASILIAEGLAVDYHGGRRINWCARLA